MSTTGRDLARRLWWLLGLGAATTLVLFGAYRGVHDDTVPLASSSTPGILAVDTAKNALQRAHAAVDGGGPAGDTTGEFHTQISVAHQSIAVAASENVTGLADRHTLQTVTGLITVYSAWVERAGQEPNASLRRAYLHYAEQGRNDIVDRLDELRNEQLDVAEEQASFPWPLRLGWGAVLVLCLALCAALVEAQRFARRRFRRAVHPPLLAATVLCGAGVAVLGWLTVRAHTAMGDSLAELRETRAADEIPEAGGDVERYLADAGFWASLSGWVLVGGVLLMTLTLVGLWPRISEYQGAAMRRPRTRTLGIVGVCLILLVAGVAGVRWARGWTGSVTVLANWSGGEKEQFERAVLEFEEEHRIDVVYQGSNALSQVLAADLAAGTQPDVAVLPGPGELMAYAAEGRLQPLDGLFEAGDYDGVWTPKVAGEDGREHTYWLPVKTGLKSMVWHAGDVSEDEMAEVGGEPGGWCLALESGATSGWPGTDWVEDILLQQAGPRVYEQWATGDLAWTDARVRKAWETWGDLVGAGDGNRVERALTDPFGQACPQQRLEHQGSFRDADWKHADGDFVHSAEVIPGARPDSDHWEVSGDLAAMLNATDEARKLIRFLADPGTGLPDFTANRKAAAPDGQEEPVKRRIGTILRDSRQTLCWDASDTMPPALRNAFHQAVLHFLVAPDGLEDQLRRLDALRDDRGPTLPVCGGG
ncbi:ABC transporter substrate-binding protein [Streptomyces sp. NPDC014995]|uniref:ABC transporter substrate-binding protein n=1 Tax=Streptomyces sp. NPDC014995 TaxID=3364936 RepID=UPI0036FDD2A9